MATVILDLNGTLPQTINSGSWTPSQFNTGKFRWIWTPTNASSHSSWQGGFTDWGMITTNDVNGGGIWVEWNGSTLIIMVVSAATGAVISGAFRTITFNAGQAITVTVDQTSSTASITVAGALTGNGTSNYTRENILTGANITVGQWGGGGYTLNPSAIGDIDDGVDGTTYNRSALVAATGAIDVVSLTKTAFRAALVAATGAFAAVRQISVNRSALVTGVSDIIAAAAGGINRSASVSAAAAISAVATIIRNRATVVAATGAITAARQITVNRSASISAAGDISATRQALALGAYDAQRVLYGTAAGTVTTESMTTQVSGSTFVICTGGNMGDLVDPPTDSEGNTYTLLATEEYQRWADYGMALWVCENANGGSGFTASQEFGQTNGFDEMTIAFMEVKAGHYLQDFSVAQALTGNPLVFGAVVTTAEAVLLAFFGGDATTGATTTVSLSNGYTVVDTDTLPDHPNGYVPIAEAAAYKSTPGSYSTTATETPDQGAIMFNIAVQVAPVVNVSASLSAASSVVVASQSKQSNRAALVAATGGIAALRQVTNYRTASVSAATDVTASGTRTISRTSSLSATGELTASRQVVANRSASLTGTGALASTRQISAIRSAVVSAVGALATARTVSAIRSSTVSALAAIESVARKTAARSAGISAATSVEAAGNKTTSRSSTIAATGTISASSSKMASRSASISASTGIESTGEVIPGSTNFNRSASLSAVSNITTSAIRTLVRSASLSALSAIVTSSNKESVRSAAVAAITAITAAASTSSLTPLPSRVTITNVTRRVTVTNET